MFYNIDLLCRKRQGKFAIIWLAATRGIKHVPRNDVQRVDIVHLCDQLLEYIMSNSQSPNKRLSLYLSAKLIHGAVLIYKQQYILLQQQICTFMFLIRRPATLFNLEDDQNEAKGKNKIQRKKKERTVEQPEPELMQQVMQTMLQLKEHMTDPIYITQREEVASSSQRPVREGFGDEGQLDLQLALLTDEAWTTAVLEHPAPPVPEIGEYRVEKHTAQSPILTGPSSKRRRLDDGPAQAHTFPQVNIVQCGFLSPDITLTEILRQADQPIDVDLEQGVISPDLRISRRLVGQAATQSANIPRQPAEPVPETAGADTNITTVQEPREAAMPPVPEELITPAPPPPPPPGRRRVIRSPRPRAPRQIDNNIVTPSRWQRGNIKRDFENDIFTLGIRNILENRRGTPCSTPTRHQDPRDILRALLTNVRLDNDTDYMSLVLKDKSADLTMDSVPAVEITGVTDQQNKTYLVPAAEQEDVSAPIAALPQHGHELLIPEVQPASTEHISRIEQQEELSQTDASAEYRQTFGPQRSGVHMSTPLPFDTESKEHGMLLIMIRNRFRENVSTPLKIEQLCVPLNRSKMATIFFALLSLKAKQYIVMQSGPDTVELDTITPGPRLWDL